MFPRVSSFLPLLYNLEIFRHCESAAAACCTCLHVFAGCCRQRLDECFPFSLGFSVRGVGAVICLRTCRCFCSVSLEKREETVRDTNAGSGSAWMNYFFWAHGLWFSLFLVSLLLPLPVLFYFWMTFLSELHRDVKLWCIALRKDRV